MPIFFYAMHKDCNPSCRGGWQACPQRYLSALRKINRFHDIRPMFGGQTPFAPVPGGFPKNGDLIILYAKNLQDLEDIIGSREMFEGLKKILVVADPTGIEGDLYHKLAPRYITRAGRDVTELEAVIRKMKTSTPHKRV